MKLRERKHRQAMKCYTIEGHRESSRALQSNNTQVKEMYYCPELFSSAAHASFIEEAQDKDIPLFELTKIVFERASYREGPDGILMLAETNLPTLDEITLSNNPLILIAEGIEKPGNLGALLRSADSAGADALICCDLNLDVFNPNVIRASQGAFFSTPTFIADRKTIAAFLKQQNIKLFSTTPAATIDYWQADMQHPTALALGNENEGLSDFWLQPDFEKIKIPQKGVSDSLNVSAAATLVLYEALRQRR